MSPPIQHREHGHLFQFQPTEYNRRLLEGLLTLGPYHPPVWYSKHAQTVERRSSRSSELDREILIGLDGGAFAADWLHPAVYGNRVLVVLPGIGGGEQNRDLEAMAKAAVEMGWRVAVLRHRGWGHPITTPRVFDGCSFEDLSVLLGVITERYPGARIAAVGMSAGANVLVRYLGCAGDASPILAGLSVCNGFQSRHACELEHRGLTGKFYSWGLTKVMQETVSRNREKLEGLPGLDVAKALRCHRFSDFAAATAVPLYRFPSVDAYLAANQCITALPHIRRPVFFLQPADDPLFMPSVQDVIPYKELGQSERFLYMEVPYGAHLGWAEGHWRRNKVTFLTRVVEAWLTFLTNEWESSSTGAPTPVPQSPPTTNGAPPPSAVAPPSPTRYPAA